MSTATSKRLLHELLRGFWQGTWHFVKSYEPPACPEIPASLAALVELPRKWVFRFNAYHLRLPLSDVEARLRGGKP